eukprot:767568-Prymnesium_polylepis.1
MQVLLVLLLLLEELGPAATLNPTGGPADGGSVVTLRQPDGCIASACLFGNMTVLATQQANGNVSCSAPTAVAAGNAAAAQWSASRHAIVLYGSAITHDGITVQLTSVRDYNAVGTLVLSPPMPHSPPESAAFAASFELLVGRGTGGSGVSVSLAPHRGLQVDERG